MEASEKFHTFFQVSGGPRILLAPFALGKKALFLSPSYLAVTCSVFWYCLRCTLCLARQWALTVPSVYGGSRKFCFFPREGGFRICGRSSPCHGETERGSFWAYCTQVQGQEVMSTGTRLPQLGAVVHMEGQTPMCSSCVRTTTATTTTITTNSKRQMTNSKLKAPNSQQQTWFDFQAWRDFLTCYD